MPSPVGSVSPAGTATASPSAEVEATSPEAVLKEYDALLRDQKRSRCGAQLFTVVVFFLRLAMLIQGVQGFIVAIEFKRDSSKHCSLPLPELQIANGVLSVVHHITALMARCIKHFGKETKTNNFRERALMLPSNLCILGLLSVLVLGGVWAWRSDADEKCDSELVDSATASASAILAILVIGLVIYAGCYKRLQRKKIASKAIKERQECIVQRAQRIQAQRQTQKAGSDASNLVHTISVNDFNNGR